MTHTIEEKPPFRCAIAKQYSAAQLKIGGKKYNICVLSMTCDMYTVKLPTWLLARLERARTAELLFRSEHWVVRKEKIIESDSKSCQISLRRMQDLACNLPGGVPRRARASGEKDSKILLWLTLAFVIACFVTPGMSDTLGTREALRNGSQAIQQLLGISIY